MSRPNETRIVLDVLCYAILETSGVLLEDKWIVTVRGTLGGYSNNR